MNTIIQWTMALFLVAAGCSSGPAPGSDGGDGNDGAGDSGADGSGDDGGGGPPCAGVVCDQPPADTCLDASTLSVHDPNGTCDPDDGTCHYQETQRTCPHGCEAGQCQPLPSGDLELVIPAGTALCTRWGWGGDSAEFNWEGKARLSLRAGTIVFPKDQTEIPADPILLLTAWPGVDTVPGASSSFVRSVVQEQGQEIHRYDYLQTFTFENRSMEAKITVDYPYATGEPTRPVLVLDDPTLFGEGTGFSGSFAEDWKQPSLVGCHFEYLDEGVRVLLADNGDRLTVTVRGKEELFTWPQPAMVFNGELVSAVLERGAETRQVTDFFDLSSAMNHHGCCPGYFAHLDQPLGAVTRIWIDEFSYGLVINYSNDAGQVLETSPYHDAP
jgi:hypothetical protein